jgi:formate dehydrogenase subunit gamma
MKLAPEWDTERARATIDPLTRLPGALLPMLHALMDEFGYVDDAAVPLLAGALNISHAEVVGVIRFYHDFKSVPQGRHILHICRAEACQSMGCEVLVDHIEHRLGITLGETTADRGITLDAVYCLGNCALSPAVMLDGRLYGRVSPDLIDRLIDDPRHGI